MKKSFIAKAIMEEMEDDQFVEEVDCEDEDQIEESEELDEMPKPELTTLAKIKAKKIEDLIKQKAGSQEANDVEAVKAKIERNKEKQAQAHAAQKASDLEARLGGKMFADSKHFKGLNVMKESYIKELRMLLENEVEQAGVLMAAKGFSQEIQTMIEKMGRLMNEELGPVVDNMRMAYGQMQAEAFGETMRTDMQGIVDNLLTVKNNIDDAVEELASGQIPQMKNDMDGEGVAMDGDMEGLGDVGDEGGLGDLDQIADDFGGDESMAGPEEEPLGRPKKESIENLKKQLSEMRKQVAKARRVKENIESHDDQAATKIFNKIKGTPNLNIKTVEKYVTRYLSMVGMTPKDVKYLTATVWQKLEDAGMDG